MAGGRIRGVRITQEERLEVRRLICDRGSFQEAATVAVQVLADLKKSQSPRSRIGPVGYL